MGLAALSLEAAGATSSLCQGLIQLVDGDACLVQTLGGVLRAQRAASCLLMPAAQDLVLLALVEEEAWILAVLQRQQATDRPAQLRVPAQTELIGSGLHLQANRLDLQADHLQLAGKRVDIQSHILALGGQVLLQGFAVVQRFAHWCGERIGKHRGQYGEVRECVAGLAEQQAGRIRVATETGYRLRAEHADIRAQATLDLDAEHIRVG